MSSNDSPMEFEIFGASGSRVTVSAKLQVRMDRILGLTPLT